MANLIAPLLLGALCAAHDPQDSFPVNPELGVPGFPDCVRRTPAAALSIDGASHDLVCAQRRAASADTVRIACVGDSITAGVCSTGGNATYPAQLQLMLDAAHGPGAYSVTNLGACGSTMLKGGDSPYWERPQFDAFVNATWDGRVHARQHARVVRVVVRRAELRPVPPERRRLRAARQDRHGGARALSLSRVRDTPTTSLAPRSS